jgi:hypothetical protein
MAEESKAYFWVLADNIFPGNRYFRVGGKKFIFQQLLPLATQGS